MSDKSPIRVFVCHSFEKHPDYFRVFEYLESREEFVYLNVSNPESIPKGSKAQLREELRAQIKLSEVLLVPVSIYIDNQDLVAFQMDCAGALGRPVIAIKAFGETTVLQRSFLGRTADIVEWNPRTLVDAIRQHARHEDTNRWEVVDFKMD